MTHTIKDGAPVVTIDSKKFGPVAFMLRSTTKGVAQFEKFTLRGVEYSRGHIGFKIRENPHLSGAVEYDYNNSYFKREETFHNGKYAPEPTPAARGELSGWIMDEAAKLFADHELTALAHKCEVQRMADAQAIELASLRARVDADQERLDERLEQLELCAPFCNRKQKYRPDEACTLPEGHKDGCEYGKRR